MVPKRERGSGTSGRGRATIMSRTICTKSLIECLLKMFFLRALLRSLVMKTMVRVRRSLILVFSSCRLKKTQIIKGLGEVGDRGEDRAIVYSKIFSIKASWEGKQ